MCNSRQLVSKEHQRVALLWKFCIGRVTSGPIRSFFYSDDDNETMVVLVAVENDATLDISVEDKDQILVQSAKTLTMCN